MPVSMPGNVGSQNFRTEPLSPEMHTVALNPMASRVTGRTLELRTSSPSSCRRLPLFSSHFKDSKYLGTRFLQAGSSAAYFSHPRKSHKHAAVVKAVATQGSVVELPLTAENVESVLDEVRPYLMSDGGNVVLHEIDGYIVRLKLQGACGSCPSSVMTMKMGIERRLMEKIPEIVAVEPITDEETGLDLDEENVEKFLRSFKNPYYLFLIFFLAMILSRISTFSSLVITQACAGHLGDLELASLAMAITVLANFNSGFLLGMASALETLCGQAFGAKRHNMLGIYLQRSWIVLFLCAILILPVYIFATPILRWTGQPEELSVMSGKAAMWCIPLHFSFVFLYPLTRFLQSQLKNYVSAVSGIIAFVFHIILTWLFVYKMKLGLFGTIMTLNFSWWMNTGCQFAYVVCGGCPISWNGFSMEAFSGLGEFIKLSVASGVMLCLEYRYYSILILLSSTFNNAEIAVDALTISLNINGWVLMFAIAFFAGTRVRVANELGSGNGEAAKFATKVSVCTSLFIGFIFSCLIIGLQASCKSARAINRAAFSRHM